MCSLSIISYAILICKEKIYITVNFSTKNCISEDMQSRNFVYFISSSGHALHGHVPQNALHYSSGQ